MAAGRRARRDASVDARWWRVLVPELVVVGVGVGVLALVAGITFSNAADARRVERTGREVIAEIVDHEGVDDILVLRYEADGATVTGEAPVDFASDYPKGRRYPAWVDPKDPQRLRLLTEPYNDVQPIVWGGLPVAGALLLLGRALVYLRRNRRVDGPWWRANAVPVTHGGRSRVMVGSRAGVASLALRVAGSVSARGDVLIGGDPSPGAPVALVRDGQRIDVVGPATCIRRDDIPTPKLIGGIVDIAGSPGILD